jgi:hypothetical protein
MAERVPVFQISLTNATVLSGAYLLFASGVELLRRTWNPRWVEHLSLSLEAFPARLLQLLGLFEPLRRAWIEGAITEFQVRLVYGATVVGLIFVMGFVVGLGMGLVARRLEAKSQ